MSHQKIKTPIAFIIFNRPELTERVFSEISKVKPPKLLVVADGPREDMPGEVEKCKATRAIIDGVDWHCDVMTNYSDINLGCKRRVSSGLDWVFNNVNEVIVLEDDCLPHPSFFRFCEEMLDFYRDDKRIMHISGDNFQGKIKRGECSYYYSKYSHVWGWASWKRAWKYYDVEMKSFPDFLNKSQIKNIFHDKGTQRYWRETLSLVFSGEIDTWDYQWNYAIWEQNGLAVLPNVNLVSNIGFGAGATHTSCSNIMSNLPLKEMIFPLIHPSSIICDDQADLFTERYQFRYQPTWRRILSKIYRFVRPKQYAM